MSGRRLLMTAALLLAAAGCTTAAHTAAPQVRPTTTADAASSTCTVKEVKAAIVSLFGAWNHRDSTALGRLFDPAGAFAFPGKAQDTLTQGPDGYTEVGGRSAIVALAKDQWAKGEMLMYRDVIAVTGGSPEGNGGGATVVASFPDGTTQRMAEVKLIYDCATHAFAHVVMTSAMAARRNADPWSWRMP